MNFLTTIYKKHAKHFVTATFFVGFIIDYFTLPNVYNSLYPFIGVFYFTLVILGIIAQEIQLHLFDKGKGSYNLLQVFSLFTSFFLGSLLSYVFIYYVRGGDIRSNYAIYLLLLFAVFLNELSLSRYRKLLLNVGLVAVAIVFYSIYNSPLIFREVSDTVFLYGLVISLCVCIIFSFIIGIFLHKKDLRRKIFLAVVATPFFISGLYFANIIPAVPLTLRDTGFYSNVKRERSGEYTFVDIPQVATKFLVIDDKIIIKKKDSSPLYFYGSVLAPAKVVSNISHTWEKYDETSKDWITKQTVKFSILGGRKEGYRGYSFIENISTGLWRVRVTVGDKRTIGEKVFIVEN